MSHSGFSASDRMRLAEPGESQPAGLDRFFGDGTRENRMTQGSTG